MPGREKDASALHDLLAADHADVHRLFDDFLQAVHANNWTTADAVFNAIELLAERHFAFEELHVFPVFDEHREAAPDATCDTTRLRAQHDEIRAALAEVGIGLQLHQLRESAMQKFVETVERHSAYEDAWADAVVECMKRGGLAGVMARLRSLVPRIPGKSS